MEKLGKKLKHDHTLTSILKFAIFSLIMLAPIFSVASRCLYVICNKNAKDSYSGLQSNTYINVNNNLLDLGDNYIFKSTETLSLFDNNNTINITNFNNFKTNNSTANNAIINNTITIDQLLFANNGTTNPYVQIKGNNTVIATVNLKNNYCSFDFEYISGTSIYDTLLTSFIYEYKSTIELDNAFEYSLSQLEQSSYYNWATNLGIYTPIHNMTSGLGAHDIVALLLAYWSIYTAIYIVFDIIIACFVKITHLLQSE